MALDRPLDPETGPVEPPSPYAELSVQLGPVQPWGTAKGRVPPQHARHLITTFGIVSSVVAGIAGAVLTLRVSAGLSGPAYAELGLAFAAALLIAKRRGAVRVPMSRELSGKGSRAASIMPPESMTRPGADRQAGSEPGGPRA